jgi:hypothetical protein
MDNAGIQTINDDVALIGHGGWYDASHGDPKYLKYTLDWRLIKELKDLTSMSERITLFKSIAQESADKLSKLLEAAVENHKTVYLLTHMPCFADANRDEGSIMEKFWEPYNVNLTLGKALENVMQNYKKRNLIVLSGHTHFSTQIHATRNIECRVGKASYFNLNDEERIYL